MSARRVAGRQPRDTIAVRRPAGWAQVMPSDSETLGFVVLEAMASGVPAVAADAGGLRSAEIEPRLAEISRGAPRCAEISRRRMAGCLFWWRP